MGWMFSYNWTTRADLVTHLQRPSRFSAPWQFVKGRVVGNHHWYLAHNPETNQTIIGLDLMQGGTRKEPGWGYKDMDESAGPCAVDCPLSLLKEASPAEGYAIEWRQAVVAYHAAKKLRPEAGMTLEVYDQPFELIRPYGNKGARGWIAKALSGVFTGNYRLTRKQVSDALLRKAYSQSAKGDQA